MSRNDPQLIAATRWTPAAAINPVFQRRIQCGAINSSLPAGDYLQDGFNAAGL